MFHNLIYPTMAWEPQGHMQAGLLMGKTWLPKLHYWNASSFPATLHRDTILQIHCIRLVCPQCICNNLQCNILLNILIMLVCSRYWINISARKADVGAEMLIRHLVYSTHCWIVNRFGLWLWLFILLAHFCFSGVLLLSRTFLII